MKWRHANGLTQREAARRAGLSQPAWQAYESGGLPKTPAALSIERLTDGAVSVTDWAESEEERAVRRARAASRRVPRKRAEESGTDLGEDAKHKEAS